MKILYVANFDDIHSAKWADYFEKDHEVIRFHAPKFGLRYVMVLQDFIKRKSPDILHCHYAGSWGLMAILTGFHPLIMTVHGSEVLLTRGIKKQLVKWILKKVDLITTDGIHMIDVMRNMGVTWEKIRLIRFGVDVEKFKPVPTEKDFYTVAYRCGDGPVYDLLTALKAMEIAGESMGVLLGNPLKDILVEEMPGELNSSDIYISTALSDAGIASTTAEAMACGLPALVTDVADNKDWVQRECLFQPGDYKTLADKIIWLLIDSELRRKYGEENRAKIVVENNYHVEMAKMEKLYQEVLA